jgi:hypothetical protein
MMESSDAMLWGSGFGVQVQRSEAQGSGENEIKISIAETPANFFLNPEPAFEERAGMNKLQYSQHFSKKRLALAFALAAVSDGLSFILTFTPPLQWAVDLGTATLLFAILGWQWILLPGLVMEAIPGLSMIPFWVLVVAGVAKWGTVRPQRR